jgi:parvulin-like peptidyl-prolyl isomerase
METNTLLIVDEQPLSVRDCLKYLQSAGKLQNFIGDVLRQYALEKELETREGLEVSNALVEQAVVDFRLQRQLTDSQAFQNWLGQNGTSYEVFHTQIVNSFKLEKLRAQIAEARLQEHFIDRKIFFDRIVLSRIVVDEKEMAEELCTQIREGASFEQLAREYSKADERIANGMMGPVSRGTLPDDLRSAIDAASPGDVLGPLQLENYWAVFRLEEELPASLEDPQLRQAMQNELFERWLVEKLQNMAVKLQVNE